ncbi:MAG: hypothetical protein EAZ44_04390 [Cytophagia bacterium]|nr:MAG: hypothetical protein EAZ44_04390 [Cytophagia bacterium]TAG43566.1 MAG: hypothetical protein EAZ31_03875 [Cytophagia bacterium]
MKIASKAGSRIGFKKSWYNGESPKKTLTTIKTITNLKLHLIMFPINFIIKYLYFFSMILVHQLFCKYTSFLININVLDYFFSFFNLSKKKIKKFFCYYFYQKIKNKSFYQ